MPNTTLCYPCTLCDKYVSSLPNSNQRFVGRFLSINTINEHRRSQRVYRHSRVPSQEKNSNLVLKRHKNLEIVQRHFNNNRNIVEIVDNGGKITYKYGHTTLTNPPRSIYDTTNVPTSSMNNHDNSEILNSILGRLDELNEKFNNLTFQMGYLEQRIINLENRNRPVDVEID
jgi:hypothetical protein